MESRNIMIVGVGGQGTLLASKLLGRILLENGYDVKVSEVHGMSQRGGSVVTYVRTARRSIPPSSTRARPTSSSPSSCWRPPGGWNTSGRAGSC